MTRERAVYALHEIDVNKASMVAAEMENLGAPTIRCVDLGDRLVAIEGTHRLAAAESLGLTPVIEVLAQTDMVPADNDVNDGEFAGQPVAQIIDYVSDHTGARYWIDVPWSSPTGSTGPTLHAEISAAMPGDGRGERKMDEHIFGVGRGHLSGRAARVAKKHGATLINYTDASDNCGYGCKPYTCPASRRHWFVCANLGPALERPIELAVLADLRANGIKLDVDHA